MLQLYCEHNQIQTSSHHVVASVQTTFIPRLLLCVQQKHWPSPQSADFPSHVTTSCFYKTCLWCSKTLLRLNVCSAELMLIWLFEQVEFRRTADDFWKLSGWRSKQVQSASYQNKQTVCQPLATERAAVILTGSKIREHQLTSERFHAAHVSATQKHRGLPLTWRAAWPSPQSSSLCRRSPPWTGSWCRETFLRS